MEMGISEGQKVVVYVKFVYIYISFCSLSPEKGFGHWWSWAHCCASPCRSRSGTPPGPCTEAGTSLHHMAGSSPTAAGPGRLTGSWAATCWTQVLLPPHRALHHWHPMSLHQSPGACLCLERRKDKKSVRLFYFDQKWGCPQTNVVIIYWHLKKKNCMIIAKIW